MDVLANQFKTEEKEIRKVLLKAGYSLEDTDMRIEILRNQDPEKRITRNKIMREVYTTMKGRICNLQRGYAATVISRFTGLSINYVINICNYIDPTYGLKKQS